MSGKVEFGSRLPTIETPRLLLRWVTHADVPALFSVFSDPEVMRYWSRTPLLSVDEARELVDEIHDCFAKQTLFQWGVVEKSDADRVIGTCTLVRPSMDNHRTELGYALGRRSWGQGFIHEALEHLMQFAIDTLGINRFEADIDPRNARSIAVIERLGFEREGYLRERYQVGGETQDTVLFGLLAREFQARKGAKSFSPSGNVRPMERRDRERVVELLQVQLSEHDVKIDRDRLLAAIDGVFDRPERGMLFVADRGAGIIGFAFVGLMWTLELGGLVAWLEELYVVPEERGQAVGSTLLDAAMAWIKTRGACGVDLEIGSGHERVESLYRRRGFQRLERTRWQLSIAD